MKDDRRSPEPGGYFSLFSDIAARFMDISSAESPGPVITESLSLLCPGCYPLYSRTDSAQKYLILEDVGNADEKTAALMRMLHIGLPFQMPLDADCLARLRSAEVLHLPGDITKILACTGKAVFRTCISEGMSIAEIAIVPYLWGDVCYGASPVLCPEGAVLPPDEVLIAFGRLSAGTLRRHTAEEALTENEAKYRALFTASGDAVLFINDGQIVDANPRAVKLFGAGSVEKLMGLRPGHLSPLHQPDKTGGIDSHLLAGKLLREAEEGNIFPFEWAFRGLDGRFFDAEVSLSRVEIAGVVHLYAVVRDISEKKRSDAAILASEERFRQVAESSFNAIITCDTRGVITYASPSVGRVLGLLPTEITGTVFSSLYADPDHGEQAMSLLTSVLEGEVINGRQFVFTGLHGEPLHLSINANRLYGNGGIIGAMAIVQDISDSYRAREAENEVQFRNYLFSAGFENNPLGMALLYLSAGGTRIVEWNAALERVSGLKKKDVIGAVLEVVSPDDVPMEAVAELIARTQSSGAPQTIRTEFRLFGGESRILKLNSAPIADPRGEGAYVMLIVRDETQRVRYEAEITESEERYRNMTDAIGEPMLTLDPDLTVLLANRAFRMVYEGLGFPAYVTGQNLRALYPPLSDRDTAAIQRVFEKGKLIKSTELLMLGSVLIRAEVTLVPVFCRGVVMQVVILLRDITAEYDVEILKKEAFEQIEKNMEQLAILNDHIRNPLQGILGICELEGMNHLPLIRSQVEEIDKLIKRLDIGYIESEKVRGFLRKHYGIMDA
ncbi:PAS domain S-box protein [Methanogenium sp. S4BF]|uniref:PAS domain-containing protein n=1 Tax=Methanogenium sp. S4BF TaxID=1789226 RepID=UPI0024176F4C|nr:PAS domain S-box protein [Methanogenium sp. S4BF]WFN34187.1 PAS domain S-box protein [Methanogenium sp. S4BF]